MPDLVEEILNDRANIRIAAGLLASILDEITPEEAYLLLHQWIEEMVISVSSLPTRIASDRRLLEFDNHRSIILGMQRVGNFYEVAVAVREDPETTTIVRKFPLKDPNVYQEIH